LDLLKTVKILRVEKLAEEGIPGKSTIHMYLQEELDGSSLVSVSAGFFILNSEL
jgi:hypothetical protein